MPSRRLLVVATVPIEDAALRAEVQRHSGDEDAEVHVVAPAADVSALQWLANDEDDARASAESTATETASAVEPEADGVGAEVGDNDPVQAIEDALRTFPADELIVVTRRDEDAGFLEKDSAGEAYERFGLPVTHLAV